MRAAGLVLAGLLAAGCSLPLGRLGADRPGPEQLLAQAETARQAGDFRRAEVVYRQALEASTATSGADRALLGLGSLHASPDNPERDYRQASRYLDRLLTEHPQSRWAREARAWRELLAIVEGQRQEMQLLRRETDRLRQEMRRERLEALGVRRDLDRLRLRELELERDRQRAR